MRQAGPARDWEAIGEESGNGQMAKKQSAEQPQAAGERKHAFSGQQPGRFGQALATAGEFCRAACGRGGRFDGSLPAGPGKPPAGRAAGQCKCLGQPKAMEELPGRPSPVGGK
jgi:hypothetical protein